MLRSEINALIRAASRTLLFPGLIRMGQGSSRSPESWSSKNPHPQVRKFGWLRVAGTLSPGW